MPGYQRSELESLAQRHGVQISPAISTLSRLTEADVPNFTTPEHMERAAHSLLQRKASKQIKKPMIRTKSRLESFEFKNITAELSDAVKAGADAGLVQTLLKIEAKITAVKAAETRKSQAEARDELLEAAVRLRKLDLVWLLAPITSVKRRNEALRSAIEIKNEEMALKLLAYGADPNSCLDLFNQAISVGDTALVEWLLRSPKDTRMQNGVLLDATSTAIKTGSLVLLENLTAAADFTGERRTKACKEAATAARVDMLLAIVLAAGDLDPEFLAAIALELFTSSEISTGTLHTLLKTLLLAGAHGNDCAAALCFAVERQTASFINLFIKYEADINWVNGRAVCKAVALGRTEILRTLLSVGNITAANSSRAVSALPEQLIPELRLEILSLLLDAGATGQPVEKELVLAIKNNDIDLVTLLKERGTATDGGSGSALTAAIQSENLPLLQRLLEGPVSQSSLQAAFPFILRASKAVRLQMTQVMFRAGVEGKVVNAALRDAVCEGAPRRDKQLIEALITAGADPSFDDARSLRHAITQQDHGVFQMLLEAPVKVSVGVISGLLAPIGMVKSDDARLVFLRMALLASPTKKSTSALLLSCLQKPEMDERTIQLIIESCLVDVNNDNGALLIAATTARSDFTALKKLATMSDRSRATTSAALEHILPEVDLSEPEKAQISRILLSNAKYMTCASQAFRLYIDLWTSFKATSWPLDVFKALLESRADTSSTPDVWESVSKGCIAPLFALMTGYPHNISCIDAALRGACLVSDDAKREQLIDLILKSSPSDLGLSQALLQCCELDRIGTFKKLLAAGAQSNYDNHAAVRTAVRLVYHDILQALIEVGVSQTAVVLAFEEAKKTEDPNLRRTMLKLLVPKLTSTELDPYLHELIRSDRDSRNVSLLLRNGVDVRYRNDENLRTLTKRNDLGLLQKLMQKANNPK